MKLLPFAMLVLVGCTTSGNTLEGYAPDAVYHDEIGTCFSGGTCAPLCVKLFGVDPEDLASCKIIARDPNGARVRGVLAGDDSVDITGSDDGTGDSVDDPPPDDGCSDDSCDPPPDDPPPDDPPPDDPPPDDGAALRTR